MGEVSVIEDVMMNLGMNSPISRFVGVGAAVAGVVWVIKPGYFFNPVTGRPSSDAALPWWSVGVGFGALAALFV